MTVRNVALHIRVDQKTTQQLLRNLRNVGERDAIFLTAYALTKTAQDIRDEQRAVMRMVFDRPTRYTLNALFVRPATRENLQASVEFKDEWASPHRPAWKYLGPHVDGGPRKKKAYERALERVGILQPHEFTVPGPGAKLDAYGNISGPNILRILSQLKAAEPVLGYQMNATDSARSRRKRRDHGHYFVVRNKRIPDGIYRRRGGRDKELVLLFVGQPHYRKRLPWNATAERVFRARYSVRVQEGFNRYVVPKLSPFDRAMLRL